MLWFRQEGERQVSRAIERYNLDVIISVGYRVKSPQGTRFRQWATRVLREHLVQGWTLNRQRFETSAHELEAAVALVRKTAQSPALDLTSVRGLAALTLLVAESDPANTEVMIHLIMNMLTEKSTA